MYKILHIPTGHYVYSDEYKTDATWQTKDAAISWIDHIIITQKFKLSWYKVNEDIGYECIESEFELIEIGEENERA
jgi:hypothetical protein